MRNPEITKEQQEELAVMSALIEKNERGLALTHEPATYVVVLETEAAPQTNLPGSAAASR